MTRYPCGDPGCAGCQDGDGCDHAAGRRVRPPADTALRQRDNAAGGLPARPGGPWSELPAVKRAVGE